MFYRKDHRMSIRVSSFGRVLVALVVLSLGLRISGDFFHSHTSTQSHVEHISAPCDACQLDATHAVESADAATLPVLPVVCLPEIVRAEAHPFIPILLRTSGRAPPIV